MSGGGRGGARWSLPNGQWAGQAPLAGHGGCTCAPPVLCRLMHHCSPLCPPPVSPFTREAPIRWWAFRARGQKRRPLRPLVRIGTPPPICRTAAPIPRPPAGNMYSYDAQSSHAHSLTRSYGFRIKSVPLLRGGARTLGRGGVLVSGKGSRWQCNARVRREFVQRDHVLCTCPQIPLNTRTTRDYGRERGLDAGGRNGEPVCFRVPKPSSFREL